MALNGSISVHGPWGDAREMARKASAADRARIQAMGGRAGMPTSWGTGGLGHGNMIHGMTEAEVGRLRDRFENFLPRQAAGAAPYSRAREFFDGLMPEGANLDPNAGAGYANARARHAAMRKTGSFGGLPSGSILSNGVGGGGSFQTNQRPYQPEFECLTYATPIAMLDGSQLPAGEARAGDKVLGSDGRVYEIKRHASAGVPEELVEIETWGGEKFTVTSNHRWPAWVWLRECLCGCGQSVAPGRCYVNHHHPKTGGPELKIVGGTARNWDRIPADYAPIQKVEASELRRGDCLLVPRKFDPIETTATPEMARLLGYYAAEGSPHGDGRRTKFALHVDERETLATDIQLLMEEEGASTGIYTESACNGLSVISRVSGDGDRLSSWFVQHAGKGSATKHLSEDVMRWPVKLKREFLRGYIAGDGHQRWKWARLGGWAFEVSFTTTSPAMGRQVWLILAQCGFAGRMYWTDEQVGADGSPRHGKWTFEIGGRPARELADLVWGDESKTGEHEVTKDHGGLRMDDDFVYVPIRKVTRRPNYERQEVFTIAVSAPDQYYCLGNGMMLLTSNSPDRQNFPVHRNLANIYWRVFYKLDPIIGTCVDLFSEMPWSDFSFSGEGVTGEIKDAFETMVEETQLRVILPSLVKEFLVLGEVAPHLFWDDDAGMWTHIALHNPDQLEVIHSPFLPNMQPVVEFRPEDRLRQILTSNNPMLRQYREEMPEEILSALVSGQNIPLSPVNCTFIPRKLHPYDVRGTSIISRMWRILMYEDCAVAQTPISLPDGTSRPVELIRAGDVILDRRGHPQVVEAAVEKPPERPYRITLYGGTKIEVTGSHNWPVWAYPRTCQCGCGEPVGRFKSFAARHVAKGTDVGWETYGDAPNARWSRRRVPAGYEPVQKLETRALRAEDYLMVPRTFAVRETNETPEYARLLGYYLAEGSLARLNETEKFGVHFDLHLEEAETWGADIGAICRSFGVEAVAYPDEERHAVSVRFHKESESWLAEKLARDGGRFSHAKRLSEDVMRWPVRLKRELLKGYLRGDGSKSLRLYPSRAVQATCMTVSDALADQLWLLFAQVGWPVTHRAKTKHKSKDGRKRRLRHEMVIQGAWADGLIQEVFGVRVERSADANAWSKVWMDDDFVYLPIKKVEQQLEAVPVFGLTVANDRSYLVHGVGTYNSIFNASIAIARRAAAPLKVAKLGDRTTGWIPDPAQESRLLELLVQSEIDPACFTLDTPVGLADGTSKTIGDLKVGEVILDRLGQPQEVTVLREEHADELVRLSVVGADDIDCTPTHKWPIWGGPRACSCGCGTAIERGNFAPHHGMSTERRTYQFDASWPYKVGDVKVRFLEGFDPHQKVTADQIRPGDFLKIPRTFKARRPEGITADHARLLGYYAAEGSTIEVYERADGSRRTGFELSFDKAERDTFVADAVQLIERLAGYTPEVFEGGRNNLQVRARRNDSHALALWLQRCAGSYSTQKRLSADVMAWPLDLKYEFIRGYVGGDGCSIGSKHGTRYVEVGSASEALIDQTRLLFAQLGTYASKSSRLQSEKSFGAGNLFYRLHVYGPLAARLSKEVWGFEAKDSKRKTTKWWADAQYVYVPVKRVLRMKKPGGFRVMNMTVSGDHSYTVGGGFGTYNSWLVYHYGIEFDLVGTQERAWKIDQSAEFIERTKLLAMGISKSFLHGEVTYACGIIDTPVVVPSETMATQAIQHLKPGDKIIDQHGQEQTVVNAWNEGVPDEVVEITLAGSRKLTFTKNHRWPVWAWPRTCACGCGGALKKAGQSVLHGHGGAAKAKGVEMTAVDDTARPRQIPTSYDPIQILRSDELQAGDCLLTPRTFDEIDPGISAAQARLLGYYAAEGCTFKDNGNEDRPQVCWSLNRDEHATVARSIRACCRELNVPTWELFPCEAGQPSNRLQVRTSTEAGWRLGTWLGEHGGHYSNRKCLSPEVMRWPLHLKEEIIRGAFRGDGSQTLVTREYKGKTTGPYLQVAYTTASKSLADQIWLILIQLGIFSSVIERKRVDKREGWPDETHNWDVQLQSDHALRLADLVWGKGSLGSQVNRDRDVRSTVRFDEQYAYIPIKKVSVVANDKPVYNIEVTGSHTYLVDGVATCNSAASGLTVFLQRLKALREFFEAVWLYPKYIQPMARMNKWIKPTQAELDHKVRTKRSKRELRENHRYIYPKFEWDRPLDPSIDTAMINAVQSLSALGVTFSRTTLASFVNRDYETELQQRVNEVKQEQDLLAKHPELQVALQPPAEGGGGGGGGGISPGIPPEAMGGEAPPEGGAPPPEGAPPAAAAGEQDPTAGHGGTKWDQDGKSGAWEKDQVQDLKALVVDGELPEEEPWTEMIDSWKAGAQQHDAYCRAALRAISSGDPALAWEAIEEWLLAGGYPPKDIRALEGILKTEGVLCSKVARVPPKTLDQYEKMLGMTDRFAPHRLLVGAPWERKSR